MEEETEAQKGVVTGLRRPSWRGGVPLSPQSLAFLALWCGGNPGQNSQLGLHGDLGPPGSPHGAAPTPPPTGW